MRRFWIGAALAMGIAAGCSSSSSNNGQSIQPNAVPAAVQGAFDSEHPYAVMNHPKQTTNSDGSTSYVIPYTRPDGTKGTATYAPTGELQNDESTSGG